MSETKEHFAQQQHAPEIKPDGKCWCPSLDESEVVDGKHKACGGIVDVNKIPKKRKLKGGK